MTGALDTVRRGWSRSPPGAILKLAFAVRDMAKAKGLSVECVKSTHTLGSESRYIYLRDRLRRQWLIRVSDHGRPAGASMLYTPNYNLVSHDGVLGRDGVETFLNEIAEGSALWFDPSESYRPRSRRARR